MPIVIVVFSTLVGIGVGYLYVWYWGVAAGIITLIVLGLMTTEEGRKFVDEILDDIMLFEILDDD